MVEVKYLCLVSSTTGDVLFGRFEMNQYISRKKAHFVVGVEKVSKYCVYCGFRVDPNTSYSIFVRCRLRKNVEAQGIKHQPKTREEVPESFRDKQPWDNSTTVTRLLVDQVLYADCTG